MRFIDLIQRHISENFQGTVLEKISCLMLMGLLTVNAFLIIRFNVRKSGQGR